MTTARARMLELTELPAGATARLHFLSITQTGGDCDIHIYNEITVSLMADCEVEIDQPEYEIELQEDYAIDLEQEIQVEWYCG